VRHKSPRFALGMAVALSGILMAATPTQAQVFTQAQADQGEKDYGGQCAMCHGAELLGPDAPALVGTEVMHNFSTGAGLYDYISVAMPPQAPGLLDEEVYVNILAYILEANGAQAGDTALDADPVKLAAIDLAAVTAVAPGAATDAPAVDAAPAVVVPQAYTWGKTLPSIK
jgi:mono/diheme cytochrome c family protein